MTEFLTIFRRFPTTFRRFPKIFQNCPKDQTNVPEHFPRISENFREFPKIAEDCRRLSMKSRICFDDTPTNLIKYNLRDNRPRSIYQYCNMAPRLSGQTSIFGVVFFVSKSLLGIERQKKLQKFAILTRKPRSHARILIYRTWPILMSLKSSISSHVKISYLHMWGYRIVFINLLPLAISLTFI